MSSQPISLIKKSGLVTLSADRISVTVVILVGIAVVLPMVFWGMPSALDLSNHFRFALPFYEGLQSGHLYPGWLAESNNGFGDASFRFYPPGLYYLMALARALTGNWYAGSLVTFGTLSVLGALGMYFWAREFTAGQTAMWAGVFYALAPYHLNQLFQALLLAEFAGAAVLPFAFLFVERVCRYRRPKDIAGLAAAYAALIFTHLPLAVIGSIALAFYALLRIEKQKFWRTIAVLGISAGIGLAASACYWTTMLFELNWIRADNFNPDPGLDYRRNFVLSTFSPDALNVWWMNILLLVGAAMFWPALILVKRGVRDHLPGHKAVVSGMAAVTLLLLLTLFMATPLSRPAWGFVRPLQETQLPWRWLAITSMAASFLLALSIPAWSRLIATKKRPVVMLALGTIAISLAFSAGHIVREARWLTPVQFEQTLSTIPGSQSVYQWLPIWVREPLPVMNVPLEAGNRTLNIESWTPEKRVFHLGAGGAQEARVRTFFYPHWQASAGGRELAVHPDQTGAMIVSLPEGAADVTLEFREPVRVRYAAGITLLGWLLIGGLSLLRLNRFSLLVQSRLPLPFSLRKDLSAS